MSADLLNRRGMLLGGMAALAPNMLTAQGFAGLGGSADGFALPDPAYRFQYPRDHGIHADFRIEWWYLTANLQDSEKREYGLQWTLFRSSLSPNPGIGWQSPQAWMGHAAVTTPKRHFAAERFARGGIGQAGVSIDPFSAWIDDWRWDGIETGKLSARGYDFSYALSLAADGPFVPQGEAGHSVKSASGQASHYYSQPFYRARGRLVLPDGEIAVSGQAWLDREWSSQPLASDQTGWDWFSLHLDTGEKLMGYSLRSTKAAPYAVATWIAPDGTPTPYPAGRFSAMPLAKSRVAERDVPTKWRLRLADRDLDIAVAAVNPQSWMPLAVEYWEGPVRASGSHPGRGYLEMTGYG